MGGTQKTGGRKTGGQRRDGAGGFANLSRKESDFLAPGVHVPSEIQRRHSPSVRAPVPACTARARSAGGVGAPSGSLGGQAEWEREPATARDGQGPGSGHRLGPVLPA